MNRAAFLYCAILFQPILSSALTAQVNRPDKMTLAGKWYFRIDSLYKGEGEQWFKQRFNEEIQLPGSMTGNGKGNDITIHTKWTGSIWDSAWFNNEKYLKYRQPGNIKVPFWLQPVKYYQGAAWYQKQLNIPASWNNKKLEFFIERSHWETTVWIDGKKIGMENSLGTPHVFDLGKLSAGVHTLTVRIDNRVKAINVGVNSHSVTDHTQTNWNGMIGDISIAAKPLVHITNIQLFPDIRNKLVKARININNLSGGKITSTLRVQAVSDNIKAAKIRALTQKVNLVAGVSSVL